MTYAIQGALQKAIELSKENELQNIEIEAILKGTLEEKVDHLFSDSDSKPEDLITLLEKKLASLKEKVKK